MTITLCMNFLKKYGLQINTLPLLSVRYFATLGVKICLPQTVCEEHDKLIEFNYKFI
jgi:hypothetical protein